MYISCFLYISLVLVSASSHTSTDSNASSQTFCCLSLMEFRYPCQVAERGCALDINWSRKRFKPELTYSPSPQTTEELKHSSVHVTVSDSSDMANEDKATLYEINLNHAR